MVLKPLGNTQQVTMLFEVFQVADAGSCFLSVNEKTNPYKIHEFL